MYVYVYHLVSSDVFSGSTVSILYHIAITDTYLHL